MLAPGVIVERWAGRSAATRAWSPPGRQPFGGGAQLGGTRTFGTDGPVAVLLHGLSEGGSAFGAHYDALPGTVVVPDLPGFGRSLDVPTPGYGTADHVRILGAWLEAELPGRDLLLVGHSTGGVLALHLGLALASASRSRRLGVVAVSAGLYDTREEGMAHIRAATPVMSRLTEGPLAHLLCSQVCGRRGVGEAVWTLLGVRWPGEVARGGARHSWRSFTQTMEEVVLASGYAEVLAGLGRAGVPVSLLNGVEDGMPVTGRAEALAAELSHVSLQTVEGAGHAVHITHPAACVAHLVDCLDGWTTGPGSSATG